MPPAEAPLTMTWLAFGRPVLSVRRVRKVAAALRWPQAV